MWRQIIGGVCCILLFYTSVFKFYQLHVNEFLIN